MKSDSDVSEDFRSFWNIFGVNNSKQKIKEIESQLLKGRVWQEKGETTAKKREKDILLEQELEFERGLEKDLHISDEVNLKYEDIVKKRILDELFDDRTFEAFYLDQLRADEQGFKIKNIGR